MGVHFDPIGQRPSIHAGFRPEFGYCWWYQTQGRNDPKSSGLFLFPLWKHLVSAFPLSVQVRSSVHQSGGIWGYIWGYKTGNWGYITQRPPHSQTIGNTYTSPHFLGSTPPLETTARKNLVKRSVSSRYYLDFSCPPGRYCLNPRQSARGCHHRPGPKAQTPAASQQLQPRTNWPRASTSQPPRRDTPPGAQPHDSCYASSSPTAPAPRPTPRPSPAPAARHQPAPFQRNQITNRGFGPDRKVRQTVFSVGDTGDTGDSQYPCGFALSPVFEFVGDSRGQTAPNHCFWAELASICHDTKFTRHTHRSLSGRAMFKI